MRCSKQWMVVVAVAVSLMGGGIVFAQNVPGGGSVPGKVGTTIEQGKAGMGAAPGKAALININTADEAQLTSLKGIGSSKAKAITQYRRDHGLFKTLAGESYFDLSDANSSKDGEHAFRRVLDIAETLRTKRNANEPKED